MEQVSFVTIHYTAIQTFLGQADKTDIDDRLTDNNRLSQICSTSDIDLNHGQNEPTLTRQC